eukprot:m.45251 g.45251  ORF g.45251 m.45251 type:complete len:64 (+) comp8616_c0_seq1:1895-2086(+)
MWNLTRQSPQSLGSPRMGGLHGSTDQYNETASRVARSATMSSYATGYQPYLREAVEMATQSTS